MRCTRKILFTLLFTSLYFFTGCKPGNPVGSISTELSSNTQVSVVTEGTKGTTIDFGEYEYEIFTDRKESLTVHLPILLEDYIDESGDKKVFLLEQLFQDYGWKEKDIDGNGSFEMPITEAGILSYDQLQKEGDYFYYDCGDMWIRFSMLISPANDNESKYQPSWIDYSFINPDSPGEYFYDFCLSAKHPHNNVDANIDLFFSIGDNHYLTDITDVYITNEQFVLLAYMITWPGILPEENPLYYLNYGGVYNVDAVRKDIMRDEYDFR